MKEFDPEKFTMEVAVGVKDEAELDRLGAAAPDMAVPFCKAHRTWPCRHCGTSHFEGCQCPVCVEPDNDALKLERSLKQVDEALACLAALQGVLKRLRDDL